MTYFNSKETVQKSRSLTASQLFEILQEEYIVCELRAKIYPESLTTKDNQIVRPQDYWKGLMEKKREKIVDIAPNTSPDTYPKVFYPKDQALYVLELPAGSADKYGIKVGDDLA